MKKLTRIKENTIEIMRFFNAFQMGKTLNYTQLMMQGKIYYYIHLVEIKLLHPFRKEFLQHPLSETMLTPLTEDSTL